MEKLTACPVCKGTDLEPFLKLKDYFLSQEDYKIDQCNTCGMKFTNPRPDEKDIGQYYKSEDYISHSNTKKDIKSIIYQMVRNYTIAQKYRKITKIQKQKGKILDVGCATGEFLSYFKSNGWEVNGIEPDADVRALALKNHQIEVDDESGLEDLKPQSFDVITMWHVLEHVYPLHERVQKLRCLLKKDGLLVIAVPNPRSHDAQRYGEYWAAYDVPRHIYHFSRKDICHLFGQYGFKVIKELPMKFDSYYVSMLSENYVPRKASMINAMRQGFKSNAKATRTGEYSSIIYFLKSTSDNPCADKEQKETKE